MTNGWHEDRGLAKEPPGTEPSHKVQSQPMVNETPIESVTDGQEPQTGFDGERPSDARR